jgi:hypothetical protein
MVAVKAALLFLTFLSGLANAQTPIQIDGAEVASHELSQVAILRVPGARFEGVIGCLVDIDIEGRVVRVERCEGDREELYERAEAEVKAYRYEPFLRNGKPIEVTFYAWVRILPPERRPSVEIPVPEVKDWKTVQFKLIRTSCFGSCPSYEVVIQGDGTVTYTGRRDVAVTGTHRGAIAFELVESLMTGFSRRDFFSFDPKYELNATDGATYTLSLSIDGQTHSVVDYYGQEAGMPMAVDVLERAIDWYSGADKWTRGNADTVPSLRSEGFDFTSQEAGRVLAHAARRGSADSVRALILAGAPLDVPDDGAFVLLTPLQGAALNPDPEVKRLLIEAGASK